MPTRDGILGVPDRTLSPKNIISFSSTSCLRFHPTRRLRILHPEIVFVLTMLLISAHVEPVFAGATSSHLLFIHVVPSFPSNSTHSEQRVRVWRWGVLILMLERAMQVGGLNNYKTIIYCNYISSSLSIPYNPVCYMDLIYLYEYARRSMKIYISTSTDHT